MDEQPASAVPLAIQHTVQTIIGPQPAPSVSPPPSSLEPPRHPGGAPTKYRPEYCQQIIDYFDIHPNRQVIVTKRWGKDNSEEHAEEVPNDLPTLERFAADLGVHTSTLWHWANEHEEFFNAVSRAKELQKHILISNGIKGLYDSRFAIFLATNVTDLKNKTITEEMGERKVVVEHRDYVNERKIIEAETVDNNSVQF